jgi:hypothetical protein
VFWSYFFFNQMMTTRLNPTPPKSRNIGIIGGRDTGVVVGDVLVGNGDEVVVLGIVEVVGEVDGRTSKDTESFARFPEVSETTIS